LVGLPTLDFILPGRWGLVPADRLGSWAGLMAQSEHGQPADAFAAGDLKTARLFGRHFAHTLLRLGQNT
jgi:hypothetical protein